jgi:hypothetical protein
MNIQNEAKIYIIKQIREGLPAGPDSNIRGDTVGRSQANFATLLPHFRWMNAAPIKTFLVVSL